jgi:hypothetical protein
MENVIQFIGVKRIGAVPMNLGDYNKHKGWKIPDDEDPAKEGYLVIYSDTYESWSPKEVFEDAYLPITGDGTKITHDVVTAFMGELVSTQYDDKTTLTTAETITGFRQLETSACVDPANYDAEIGEDVCRKQIEKTLWKCLGFVLQWANYGLKGNVPTLSEPKAPPQAMTFGHAIEAMKQGKKVARAGWNGKDMFIYHVPADNYKTQTGIAREAFGEDVDCGAYICMKPASGPLVIGWLASQTDMLSDDWQILE